MIVVNYWHDENYDATTDGYELTIEAIVNDSFSLTNDLELVELAIDHDNNFKPKDETLYEVHLERCTIASDPIPERAFVITKTVELEQVIHGNWYKKPIEL